MKELRELIFEMCDYFAEVGDGPRKCYMALGTPYTLC